MNRNSLPEALAALEAAPLVGRIPRGFHDARARLLLQAGRIDQALDAFGHCMTGYAVYPSFGDLPPSGNCSTRCRRTASTATCASSAA